MLCTDDPLPPSFLGNRSYDLRSVDLGAMLCYTDARGQPVLEWTVEPLLVMVRATGTTPEDLVDWRDRTYGIPLEKVVAAANKKAQPPFPTTGETALLAHVPEASRKQLHATAGGAAEAQRGHGEHSRGGVRPVAGRVDHLLLPVPRRELDERGVPGPAKGASGGDCAANPPNFLADAPYQRGGDTGMLSCGSTNNLHLIWTSNKLNILAFAFQAWDQQDLIEPGGRTAPARSSVGLFRDVE